MSLEWIHHLEKENPMLELGKDHCDQTGKNGPSDWLPPLASAPHSSLFKGGRNDATIYKSHLTKQC